MSRFDGLAFSLVATAALVLFGGCSSPEQRKQRAAEEAARQQQKEQAQLERLRNQCLKYGFTPQSDAFAKCVQDEMRQEQAAASAKRKSDSLLAQCQQAMMLRGSGAGAGVANAAKCESDPQAHLRGSNADQRLSATETKQPSGTYVREYVSGWKRVCIYQRAIGEGQLIIESSAYCPKTIP